MSPKCHLINNIQLYCFVLCCVVWMICQWHNDRTWIVPEFLVHNCLVSCRVVCCELCAVPGATQRDAGRSVCTWFFAVLDCSSVKTRAPRPHKSHPTLAIFQVPGTDNLTLLPSLWQMPVGSRIARLLVYWSMMQGGWYYCVSASATQRLHWWGWTVLRPVENRLSSWREIKAIKPCADIDQKYYPVSFWKRWTWSEAVRPAYSLRLLAECMILSEHCCGASSHAFIDMIITGLQYRDIYMSMLFLFQPSTLAQWNHTASSVASLALFWVN